jgi:tRNA A-37 threonylcarbamoyl transferase component Bud32
MSIYVECGEINGKHIPIINIENDSIWRTQWKEDGFDYRKLLKDFKDGKIEGQRLTTGSPYRTVHRVKCLNREFVIKTDIDINKRDKRFEKRVFTRFWGTQYSRLINKTFEALNKGCPVVQETYLVSERMEGPYCQEAYIIAEYIPGHSFIREEYRETGRVREGENVEAEVVFRRPGPWLANVAESLAVLHDYGLASNDAIISNFIVTPEGQVKVIDLTLNGPMIVCQANDVLKMRRSYKTNVPVRSALRKIVVGVIGLWNSVRVKLRKLRGKTPPPPPKKIWEDYDKFPKRPEV